MTIITEYQYANNIRAYHISQQTNPTTSAPRSWPTPNAMSTGRRPTSASRTTEVRNLDPQDAQMLGHILDTLEGWEQLMKCIPRAQSGPATFDNPHHFKYSFNDIW